MTASTGSSQPTEGAKALLDQAAEDYAEAHTPEAEQGAAVQDGMVKVYGQESAQAWGSGA